jgi:hypothetical protein
LRLKTNANDIEGSYCHNLISKEAEEPEFNEELGLPRREVRMLPHVADIIFWRTDIS